MNFRHLPAPALFGVANGGRTPGHSHQSVLTIHGKGWFMILRANGPLEPWFNKTWWPGAMEPMPWRDTPPAPVTTNMANLTGQVR